MTLHIKTVAERDGGHIKVRLFTGETEGSLALAGQLTFDGPSYDAFTQLLSLGAGECVAHNLDYGYLAEEYWGQSDEDV